MVRSLLWPAFRSVLRPVSRLASVRPRSRMTVVVRPSFRSGTEARTFRPHLFPCFFLLLSQYLLHFSTVAVRHFLHFLTVCGYRLFPFLVLPGEDFLQFPGLVIRETQPVLESVYSHFNPLRIRDRIPLRHLSCRALRPLCEGAANTYRACNQYCNQPFHILEFFL